MSSYETQQGPEDRTRFKPCLNHIARGIKGRPSALRWATLISRMGRATAAAAVFVEASPVVTYVLDAGCSPERYWRRPGTLQSSCHTRLCNPWLWQPGIGFAASVLHRHATRCLPPPSPPRNTRPDVYAMSFQEPTLRSYFVRI